MTFLGVEPIEVLRFEPIPGEWAYVSLGMSRRPMTASSELVVASDGPRAELMLHVGGGNFGDAWRTLALLAAAPAVEGVVYVPDMTVDTGRPLADGSRCTGAVVAESAISDVSSPQGMVQVLQLLPATSTELAWARVHGTAALRLRWQDEGADLMDLARVAVRLD